jgi:hypothetical protein
MPEFGEFSPYDMFAAVRPRLLNRRAEAKTVSQLGQAVSDALDKGCTDRDVQLMIADLEAERERATAGELDGPWELPLAGLLGVLRQTLHNRAVMAASLDPGNEMLRDKVVMAIDVGTNTPAAIAALLHAPTTVVSLVMHQLTDDGLIEPAESTEDQRQRPYRRVEGSYQDTEDNAVPQPAEVSVPVRERERTEVPIPVSVTEDDEDSESKQTETAASGDDSEGNEEREQTGEAGTATT